MEHNKEYSKAHFQSIALYGREIRPMTKILRDKIRTVVFDQLRKTLQLTCKDKRMTERIWQEMEINSSITRNLECVRYSGVGMQRECRKKDGPKIYFIVRQREKKEEEDPSP